MIIIGFSHRSRVGKSTCQRFLSNHIRLEHPHLSVQQASLFELPKNTCYSLFKWSGLKRAEEYEQPEFQHLKNAIIPELGISPVDLWVKFAIFLRDAHPKTIINSLLSNAKADVVIIDDVRDPIEIEEIYKLKGFVFNVTNSRAPLLNTYTDELLADFTNWTGTISNEGTVAELRNKVIEIFNPILKGK